MLKVLFVASGNHGGIGNIVKSQGESLNNTGTAVDYFAIQGKGIKGYLSNIFRLRSYVLETKPDIIHAHYSLCGIIAALAFPDRPLVVSLMGSDTKTGFFSKSGIRWFTKSRWERIIVKSPSMQAGISGEKSIVTPNGVDLHRFKPLPEINLKKKFRFSDNKKTILFLANPTRESKNFSLAEHAFSLIHSVKTELKVCYGVPMEDIPNILNAADVVLLTSRWEGSPNVIKESMACNCPIVATNVGDIAWLFGNAPGHFLTSFSPADVADKIHEALKFSEDVGSTTGRERLLELGLDSETIAKRINGIYEEVLLSKQTKEYK